MKATALNKTDHLHIRVKPHERELVERAALADKERHTVWARDIVLAAARRRLAETR
jgi:uncharacterized protein (DUF1778 family)